MTQTNRDILINNMSKLDAKGQNFASSLLRSRNPTAKQQYWINKLAEQAVAPPKVVATEEIDNILGIVQLLQRPHGKLKWPKIIFRANDMDMQLSIAGPNSSYPGSVNVKNYISREWYGRIHIDGKWEPSKGIGDQSLLDCILAALRIFAANPAKIAAQYGFLTGNCCFCAKSLTHDNSTSVGYGPVCASNYGLPWGN